MKQRVCVVCGAAYSPKSNRQLRCPECKRRSLVKSKCDRCGREVVGMRGQNGHRLCAECFPVWQREQKLGRPTVWNLESVKQRAGRNAEHLERIRASAVEAQRYSPLNGPVETNIQAKLWYLRAPDGQEIVVRNLAKFLRDNPDAFPSAVCARNAFIRMARTIQGTERRKPTYQHHGWSMVRVQETPEDSAAYLEACASLREQRAQLQRPERPKRVRTAKRTEADVKDPRP